MAENSDALMERYLEGDEISHEEIVTALKDGTNHGHIFPVTCGVATQNLATNRLLDAIVEDLPSPVKHGGLQVGEMTLEPNEDKEVFAYVFKTRADPFAGRINLFRVYQGVLSQDSHVLNTRAHVKERVGQLVALQGSQTEHVTEFGPGDIGAVAKLKETRAGDWLAARDEPIQMPSIKLPAPVMAFAVEPSSKGDEEKVFTALRRLQEEDPTIDLHRDRADRRADRGRPLAGPRRGDRRAHEVALRRRGQSQAAARALPGDDPQVRPRPTAATRSRPADAASSAIATSRSSRWSPDAGFEFVDAIKGGVIPSGFIPAVEKGVIEAMREGAVAGYPVKDVRVRLYDGSYHTVDSSEMAFKVAGSLAMKQALEQAGSVLLEPIMLVTSARPRTRSAT